MPIFDGIGGLFGGSCGSTRPQNQASNVQVDNSQQQQNRQDWSNFAPTYTSWNTTYTASIPGYYTISLANSFPEYFPVKEKKKTHMPDWF